MLSLPVILRDFLKIFWYVYWYYGCEHISNKLFLLFLVSKPLNLHIGDRIIPSQEMEDMSFISSSSEI